MTDTDAALLELLDGPLLRRPGGVFRRASPHSRPIALATVQDLRARGLVVPCVVQASWLAHGVQLSRHGVSVARAAVKGGQA